MSITLRAARLEEIQVLEILIARSARGLRAGLYTERQIDGAIGTVFGVDTQLIRDGTYFVAEWEGRLAGCGGWSRRKTLYGADAGKQGPDAELDPKIDAARIRAFFVDPDFARRGIGAALIEASEAAAAAAGFRRIDIGATLPGELLYARFGYRVVERVEIPLVNGERMMVVRMTKEL